MHRLSILVTYNRRWLGVLVPPVPLPQLAPPVSHGIGGSPVPREEVIRKVRRLVVPLLSLPRHRVPGPSSAGPRLCVVDVMVRRPCTLVEEDEVVQNDACVDDVGGVLQVEKEPPLKNQELPLEPDSRRGSRGGMGRHDART